MKIYIKRSDGAYVVFEGMSQAAITTMLADQNRTCEFIDEATYQAATQRP